MATKSFPKYPTLRKRIALELFRLIKRNESKTHKLHTLFWECTLRCNVACRHCGSDCRVSSQQKDMPREDFLRVIDEILPHVDPHRLLVIFTGGEALLRNDLALCGQERLSHDRLTPAGTGGGWHAHGDDQPRRLRAGSQLAAPEPQEL